MKDLLKGGQTVKGEAVKVCVASEEWLSVGLEGFTRHVLALGYLSGSMCGAGAPAALLMLPPKLPDVSVCSGGCHAALQLLWWPPVCPSG